MTIASLEQFKGYIRELENDLDPTLQLALESASAEVRHFLGFDPAEAVEPDIVMACCLLAQAHVDAGTPSDNDHRREAAYRLLRPHRVHDGIAAA